MDEGSGAPLGGEALQFDKVEHGPGAAPRACRRCQRFIADQYFEIAGNVICGACAAQLGGSKSAGSLPRAFVFGIGAALVGTIAWFAIIKIMKGEFGLVAIGVGLFVGFAVRKGAQGMGGWKYQALAMALTYMSITAAYVPLVVKAVASRGAEKKVQNADETSPYSASSEPTAASRDGEPAGAGAVVFAFLVVLGLAFASPFLAGAENIMGIIIIGIALYEAWKINRRVPLHGPFRLAP